MVALFLTGIYPTLQERIITKFEWKSYFRLQQTCRFMEELIRTCQNIKVHLDRKAKLEWKEEQGTVSLHVFDPSKYKPIDVTALPGVQFKTLEISPALVVENFDDIYIYLKKSRLRCVSLSIDDDQTVLSEETLPQWVKLFKLLKLIRVSLNSKGAFRGIYNLKQIKEIAIRVEPKEAIDALKEILPRFRLVAVFVQDLGSQTLEEVFDLFTSTLQILRSDLPPTLRYLEFGGGGRTLVPPMDKILEKFREFNPMAGKQSPSSKTIHCEVFPTGSCCLTLANNIAAMGFRSSGCHDV